MWKYWQSLNLLMTIRRRTVFLQLVGVVMGILFGMGLQLRGDDKNPISKEMKWNNILWYCLLLCILNGCNTGKEKPEGRNPLAAFDEIIEKKGEFFLDLDSAKLYSIGNFYVTDSLVVTQNPKTDYTISAYNMNTGSKKDFLRRGRGPGELISLFSMSKSGSNLTAIDGNNKKMADIRVMGDSVAYDLLRLPEDFAYVSGVKGNDFIVLAGLIRGGRYVYYDIPSEKSETYCSYPVGGEYENENDQTKSLIMLSTAMAIKPDQTKFVCAHFNSGIIDICNIENQGIERHKLIDFYYPAVGITENGDKAPRVAVQGSHPMGFLAVQADDRYIYALYSGKSYNDYGVGIGSCEYLLTFDWDGNPANAYHFDQALTSIYWNEKQNILYGVSTIDDREYIIKYHLNS